MAVPKKRTTKARRNNRRSHHGTARLQLVKDPASGELVMPHMVNPTTGTYRGRQVIDVMAKLSKQERKAKEKAAAETDTASS